jgi:GNAT superfamily N-acetyltransferase
MEWRQGDYWITDDKARMDLELVCFLLGSSYWAADRSREIVQKSVQQSFCFSLFHDSQQVGFGRVISDRATFSYLCDVIIHPDHRGKGLGKWLIGTILEHPEMKHTRFSLFTRDAQSFYEQFGFAKHRFDCLVRPTPKTDG